MQIEVRGLNERIGPEQRGYIERRVLYALGRFGARVRRVMVRLEDLNGPRGGLDKRCHLEVLLQRGGLLVVDVRDMELGPAVSRAAERMARRVRDELTTRRDVRRRNPVPTTRRPAA